MAAIQHVDRNTKKGNVMKTLILGGCGFIGRHIVQTFAEQGMPMVVLDVHANPARSTPQCTYVAGDFSDTDKLDAVMAQHAITHVVHLVSTTLPKSSNEDKPYDVDSNVIQTLHLLDLCVKHQVQRLLFMSSGGTVYGVPETVPVSESHPNHPLCSYGISKLAIEKYLYLYRHLHGLNYVVLRAANPYGPGQNPFSGQGVVANFVHKMYTGQRLEVWGDGETVRDYFHVRDLADLTWRALCSAEVGVFNAGSGVGLSINRLIDALQRTMNMTADVTYQPARGLDVPAIVLDSSAAFKVFGWRALTNLEAGIRDYEMWYSAEYQRRVA
jgi:UDP-glucose 4-epimerase